MNVISFSHLKNTKEETRNKNNGNGKRIKILFGNRNINLINSHCESFLDKSKIINSFFFFTSFFFFKDFKSDCVGSSIPCVWKLFFRHFLIIEKNAYCVIDYVMKKKIFLFVLFWEGKGNKFNYIWKWIKINKLFAKNVWWI